MNYVKERFILDQYTQDLLQDMEPNFGYNGFGEFIFYRTYSRNIDGHQENWADCVIRVINGIMSIRKDWYIKNHISWSNSYWNKYARDLAISMFKMEWLPPGRGLWACGTEFIYERGAMALYNCAFTNISFNDLSSDINWLMDSLMLGVGVGFSPLREEGYIFKQTKGEFEYVIPDSREGWAESIKELCEAYMYGTSKPRFIYDEIREAGLPIKGFGGISSGPEPLKELHIQIEQVIEKYMTDKYYDSVILKTDTANLIGCCVIAGNVRRSAELALLDIDDPVFKDLKDYNKYPNREAFGYMSNNAVTLKKRSNFEKLGEIAERVIERGEPGYLNLKNFQYGRIGKKDKVRKDEATGINPCGEVPLEHRETCNIDETLPTVCEDPKIWYNACKYATFYCSTVSLLPTHQPSTNRVVARNRRIGVGIIDFTGWIEAEGLSKVTKYLRKGYQVIRKTNQLFNGEAGIPESIRVTTIKPGGTVPKLAGKTSGAGYPNFQYEIRRVRVQRNSPVAKILIQANVPFEADYFSKNTDIFEFPLECGPAQPAEDISLWQQAMNLVLLQREWADNAVSNTLNFRPKWKLLKCFSIFNGHDNPYKSAHKWLDKNIEYISKEAYDFFLDTLYVPTPFVYTVRFMMKIKFNDDLITDIKIFEYDPTHEEGSIEPVLAAIAPLTKSVSLLPHSPKGAYLQMPEEGITRVEYERRLSTIRKIDWSQLNNSDGQDEKFCSSDACEIINQGTV